MKKSYTINDLSTYELYRKIKSRDFMNKYIRREPTGSLQLSPFFLNEKKYRVEGNNPFIETKKSIIQEDYDNCNCLKLLKNFFINLI